MRINRYLYLLVILPIVTFYVTASVFHIAGDVTWFVQMRQLAPVDIYNPILSVIETLVKMAAAVWVALVSNRHSM